jgi:hypothetical protein
LHVGSCKILAGVVLHVCSKDHGVSLDELLGGGEDFVLPRAGIFADLQAVTPPASGWSPSLTALKIDPACPSFPHRRVKGIDLINTVKEFLFDLGAVSRVLHQIRAPTLAAMGAAMEVPSSYRPDLLHRIIHFVCRAYVDPGRYHRHIIGKRAFWSFWSVAATLITSNDCTDSHR